MTKNEYMREYRRLFRVTKVVDELAQEELADRRVGYGRLGGIARAKKYSRAQLRKWAKLGGRGHKRHGQNQILHDADKADA